METPEGLVKRECKAYLKSIGAYFFFPVQVGYGTRTVDALVCYKGRFFAVEVKRGDRPAVPAPRQQTILDEIAAAGGGTITVNDVQQLKAFVALMELSR